ncbi:MAG: hypothetical protein J6U54_13435 [Clostridiales bacterium]|nr:hypothetical protein [Clostridiales bacterium]
MKYVIKLFHSIVCLLIGGIVGALFTAAEFNIGASEAHMSWRFGNAEFNEPMIVLMKDTEEEKKEEAECKIGFRY